MITHGTPGDWFVWAFMMGVSLGAAFGCYRMGRLVGEPDGECLDVFYGSAMFAFLLAAFIIFINAPFHVA